MTSREAKSTFFYIDILKTYFWSFKNYGMTLMYFFVFSDCLQNSHGLLSLEILDVTERDMGQFTCKAINSEGEVTCSASLEVMGKQVLLYYIISAMECTFEDTVEPSYLKFFKQYPVI
jgi:hypothetical protein